MHIAFTINLNDLKYTKIMVSSIFEPHHEKTSVLPIKTQIGCAVNAELNSAFVLAVQIVQSLCFLNLKLSF